MVNDTEGFNQVFFLNVCLMAENEFSKSLLWDEF